MADKKISQLTALSAANLAPSTDVLAIVDTSATETKKIAAQDIVNGVLNVASAVGIGTTSPASYLSGTAKLVAYANANAQNSILVRNDSSGASASSAIALNATGNTWGIEIGSSAKNSNALTFQLDYGGTNSTKMTLDSSGNLGLGVTPRAWAGGYKSFDITGPGAIASTASGDTFTQVANGAWFNGTNWIYQYDGIGAARYQMTGPSGGGNHSWHVAGSGTAGNTISFTQAMTLDANTNLLCNGGTTGTLVSASRKGIEVNCGSGQESTFALNVNGALTAVAGIASASDFVVGSVANIPMIFRTNNTPRARITSGGNLLVGCTDVPSTSVEGFCATGTSSGNLSSSGASTSAYNHWLFLNGNGTVGSISTSGSATTYSTSSDRRLKDNIAPADSAGAVIDAIEIVKHDWKAGGHTRYGMIAQDLHSVAPEAVSVGDADDVEDFKNPWGVDYSKLVPMLVKELQSLRKRVAELEAK